MPQPEALLDVRHLRIDDGKLIVVAITRRAAKVQHIPVGGARELAHGHPIAKGRVLGWLDGDDVAPKRPCVDVANLLVIIVPDHRSVSRHEDVTGAIVTEQRHGTQLVSVRRIQAAHVEAEQHDTVCWMYEGRRSDIVRLNEIALGITAGR